MKQLILNPKFELSEFIKKIVCCFNVKNEEESMVSDIVAQLKVINNKDSPKKKKNIQNNRRK